MRSTLRSLLKMVFFLLFGLLILWLLYNNLNAKYLEDCQLKGISPDQCSLIDKVYQDFRSANPFWLVVICISFFISNISRSLRWQQLLSSLGYQTRWQNSFHCVMLAYFANLGFPRLGEVVRAGTFAKYEDIPFEKVMGTVAVDRIIDLFCFGLVFLLALLLQYDLLWNYISSNARINLGGNGVLMILLLAGAVIGFWMVWQYREKLRQNAFLNRIARTVKGFLEGVRSLQRVKNKPLLVFHSVNIWLMYFLMTYLCFKAFTPTAHLDPMAGLLIFVFGSLGMIIPTPGGMGSYHALVIAGLALYGINQNDAFSFAMIIFFTINIFGNILFGIIALILLPGYNRSYQPVRT